MKITISKEINGQDILDRWEELLDPEAERVWEFSSSEWTLITDTILFIRNAIDKIKQ